MTKKDLEKEVKYLKLQLAKINDIVTSDTLEDDVNKSMGLIMYRSDLSFINENVDFICNHNLSYDFFESARQNRV